ncbi:hypothetical protein HYDPIDRAFT_28180 [Hydnomerulius pinastri MD-312]|uniref:DUF6534 domain-containing protein n=1 Tax=Hydnomerulius pinastri MD-312 TaxID=994086 RepID=A0A0C9W1N2_9AGAM|nr:hypothetical protein HYDPIDRAFT_28180 [Hydnomerulius pinastri MD-312]
MASIAEGVNLGLSMGPGLAGAFISLVFYGISILQSFIYYVQYPKDKLYVKLLVAVLLVLDTAHKFLLCAGSKYTDLVVMDVALRSTGVVWNTLVQNYGDFLNLLVIHPPILLASSVTTLVSVIVQSYFVYRVWFLSRGPFKWIFPCVLTPFVVAQPIITWYYTAKAWNAPVFEISSDPVLMKLTNASNGTAAAVDIVIAIAMCTLLAMGRTGFNKKTDRMLLRLMIISLNSGLWTAVLALLSTVLLVALPSTEIVYAGVYYPLCTLYCNTLLANLNVRSYLRGDDHAYRLPAPPSSDRSTGRTNSFPVLNIAVETSELTDLESFEVGFLSLYYA